MESNALVAAGTSTGEADHAVRTTVQTLKTSLLRRLVYFVPLSENEMKGVERRRGRKNRKAARARLREDQEGLRAASSADRQRMRDRSEAASGKLPDRYGDAFDEDSENAVSVWAQQRRQNVDYLVVH